MKHSAKAESSAKIISELNESIYLIIEVDGFSLTKFSNVVELSPGCFNILILILFESQYFIILSLINSKWHGVFK